MYDSLYLAYSISAHSYTAIINIPILSLFSRIPTLPTTSCGQTIGLQQAPAISILQHRQPTQNTHYPHYPQHPPHRRWQTRGLGRRRTNTIVIPSCSNEKSVAHLEEGNLRSLYFSICAEFIAYQQSKRPQGLR